MKRNEWVVVDHDTDEVVSGPFSSLKQAYVERRRLERNKDEMRNLWIVPR